MSTTAILHPVIVQVTLTFFMLFWMAKERLAARMTGEVPAPPGGLRAEWKGRSAIVSNSFHNQLEMPMLFYAVAAFSMIANGVDGLMVAMAWIYALLRIIHATIHTTYNHVPHRFFVYVVSNFVLLAMWIRLAIHIV